MATSHNTTAPGELPFTLADKNLLQFSSYVNGEFVAAKKGKTFDVLDPGNGNAWASCPDNDEDDVEPAVQSSYAAFQSYSKYTPRKRAQLLLAWHQLIVAARDDLARIVVHETGKPMAEALGEIDYATTFSWWFVGEADRAHGSARTSAIPGRRHNVDPSGLPPRNPAARLATRAGFPPGALNVLTTSLGNTPAVAEALCLHPRVKKVSFTGSTHVGKLIAGLCARNLKKTTLELGGNCPFVVFDDADVEQALGQLMALKWRHAGQACVTSNRVYVQSGIYDVFVAKLVEQTRALKVGHGMDEGVTMGALTTPRGLDKAEELYRDAVAKGAKTVLGTGQRMGGSGYFMAPTVLTDMTDDMAMSHEEIFAPILGVYRFESEEEVTQRANNTPLGLASYVFSKNIDRLWRMFENLEAGMIGMNTGNSSAAEAPFGGIKDSGYGKESGKDVAINEFLIIKTGTMAIDGHY
ncbi:succinate-semialdehyde dehydrogenase [Verticillium dahliae VdLs.17]|uniref:Succinate-semialdehyde dehydrogenase n=1 Tax=Verticillium dahliae (strain VdLs.17 / ATCC MYA-4575 / FGSC 10137) TaxID=498257 RepID=G2X604_VERDV|nr:succinate-semialdehyde dehydrogenase [Verticillium dahliae VdLs.17]EGY14156.1 succinate-semialdehyde dehydrogenase [Verticillium dahliae VdLs.17]